VSDITENMEVVRDRKFQFASGQSNELTKQLTFLLDVPDYVKREARTMQRRVKAMYNWERQVKRYEELYERVLHSRVALLATKEA